MNSQISALKEFPPIALPLLHALIALWGLADCFFGLLIFKVTIRIFMAFAGAVGAAAIAAQYYPDSGAVFFGACVAGLVIGFIIGWFVCKIGIVVLSVFAGFVLIAPFAATLGQPWDAVVPCVVGIIVGLLAFVLLEPVVIASTALTGAYRLVFGTAFFLGGPSIMDFVGGARRYDEMFTGTGRWIFVITIAIAAIGCYVQFSSWRGRKKSADEE
jgi:hypothetical protein